MSQVRTTAALIALAFALGACEAAAPVQPENASNAASSQAAVKGGGGANEVQMYTADLRTLNNSGVTGTAQLHVTNGTLLATLHAKGPVPGIRHMQHIHITGSCPFPESEFDENGDGLVSFAEGLPAYGGVLVNLNDNLSVPGVSGTFPLTNPAGVVNFQAKKALTDLPDLDLAGRTVVVHGAFVDGTFNPSLPVACGTVDPAR